MSNPTYDETVIEESDSGIHRVYGRNDGGAWEGIGSTASKSEAIDIQADWLKPKAWPQGATYLTEAQMDMLIEQVRGLRVGHRLAAFAKAYLVKVDGKHHWFKNIVSLRKFLVSCTFPPNYRWFRNMDNGITIDLDTD